jgi:RNA recognition motif-containing protein
LLFKTGFWERPLSFERRAFWFYLTKQFKKDILNLFPESSPNLGGRKVRDRSENKSIKIKMAKKLYVGGLPYETTEDSLKELFSKAGTVDSAVIITDKISGRSKGFGFVEMSTDEEAQKAIEMFNGQELEGRNIIVDEARPMKKKPFRDFSRPRRFER